MSPLKFAEYAHNIYVLKTKGAPMKQFDLQAPKKPTNLTINSDLLAKAKAEDINLSATLEAALADKLVKIRREKWLKENAGAISAYNEFVEENGLFSDGIRSF